MNKTNVSYLFFLCSPVPNDPWTSTSAQPRGWGPLVYMTRLGQLHCTCFVEVYRKDFPSHFYFLSTFQHSKSWWWVSFIDKVFFIQYMDGSVYTLCLCSYNHAGKKEKKTHFLKANDASTSPTAAVNISIIQKRQLSSQIFQAFPLLHLSI